MAEFIRYICSEHTSMSTAAEFLVTSLLADALLLDEWGAQAQDQQRSLLVSPCTATFLLDCAVDVSNSGMHPLPLSASSSPSTAAESSKAKSDTDKEIEMIEDDEPSALDILKLRRRRNRESMQRARQKQKNRIESMRGTLEKLSLQFEQLREQQRHSNENAIVPSVDPTVAFARLEAAYGSLAETSHRLKAEKFLLQHLLVEHEKTKLRLIEAIKSFGSGTVSTDKIPLAAEPFFEYTDITLDQAQDAISDCYQRIVQYEQTALPLAHWLVDASGPNCTFGWTVSCEISTGNNFFLSVSKRLPGVSAQEAAERSWAVVSKERRSDKSPTRRLAHSAVLQTLNDSTCVVADDLYHPIKTGVCMRTISVRFRTTTKRGFAVGMGAVNSQDLARRRQSQPTVEHLDGFSWQDFVDEEDGSGCVVTIKSLTQYNTNENLHLRLVNALCATWNWENEVIKSPIRLLAA